MFGKGLQFLFNALFAYNNKLIPYDKWTLSYARKLPWLPRNFEGKMKQIYLAKSIDKKDLRRRENAFMHLWRQLSPRIQKETGMSLKEIDRLV